MAGNLFEAKRFWVDDKVPQRDRWLKDITEHGGVLTNDINTADIRIADHVKRAGRLPPEESVSWTFIEQSVKKGALQNIDRHRIAGIARRPVTTSTKPKGRRTPFTSTDDQLLSNWLAMQEKQGASLSGNLIFQQLAEMCPRHTAHSWRSRSIEYKGLLPKPKKWDPAVGRAEQDATSEEEELAVVLRRQQPVAEPRGQEPAAVPRRTQRSAPVPPPPMKTEDGTRSAGQRLIEKCREPDLPNRRRSGTQREEPGQDVRSKEPEPASTQRRSQRPPSGGTPSQHRTSDGARTGRVKFTEDDDALLLRHVEAALRESNGFGSKGNKIYLSLAEQYPDHTDQSWRDRYVRHLQPRLAAQAAAGGGATPPSSTPRQVVKFTKEDDQLLLQYVKEAATEKNGSSGNKIYQDLEEEHPRHSWHSWRNRYVRHLEPRLRAQREGEPPAGENSKPQVATAKQTSALKPVAREPRVEPAEHDQPAPASVTKFGPPPATNNSADNDGSRTSIPKKPAKSSFLVVEIESRRRTKSPTVSSAGNMAVPLSTARSSAASSPEYLDSVLEKTRSSNRRLEMINAARLIQRIWRRHRVRTLLKQYRQHLAAQAHNLPVLQAHARGVLHRSRLKNFFENELIWFQANARRALVRRALRQDARGIIAQKTGAVMDDNEAVKEEDVEMTEGEAVPDERDAGPDEEEVVRDDLPMQEMARSQSEDPVTSKANFYDFLNRFLQGTRREMPWATVQRRALDLWELWSTVKSLDEGRSQSARNWELIAERLGFDWIETPEVTLELKTCYEETLGDFELFYNMFEAQAAESQTDTDSQAGEEEPDVDMEEAEPELPDAAVEAAEAEHPSHSLAFDSSPPVQGQKRRFEKAPLSLDQDLAFMPLGFVPSKRRRYGEHIEIPSTPETSPEKRMKTATVDSKWTERRSTISKGAGFVIPTQQDRPRHASPDRLPHRPPHPPTNARLEPETQNFGFDAEFHSQPDLESQAEITPSQQLHIEDEHLTPIPFSGFKAPKALYRSPLSTYPDSSMRRVPDSAGPRHTNGDRIMWSVENRFDDPFEDDGPMPKPSQARLAAPPRSPSPVEAKAKRRSLPASFHRAAVSPPRTAKQPVAAPRASLPTSAANTRPNHHSAPPPGRQSTNPRRTTGSPFAAPRVIVLGRTPPEGSSLREKVEFYKALGYKQEHILAAFSATMTWGLAAVVMEELKAGKGIPENWEGVWTARDDKELKKVKEFEIEEQRRLEKGNQPSLADVEKGKLAQRYTRRLQAKHQLGMIKDRRKYFRM
ncbi:hypothetical protein GE09DRAFT_1108373 [Coniochaeta sp. 2T2.1]|nr:hypothetical protein GE09DRAFT_1108373 [Coniochaeta sp. 2T2.1]